MSDVPIIAGPDRKPTSTDYIYPNPRNRYEERESLKIFRYPSSSRVPIPPKKDPIILITFDENREFIVNVPGELGYVTKQTPIHGGIYDINKTTGEITVAVDMLPSIPEKNHLNLDGGWGVFIVELYFKEDIAITDDDIEVVMPFGFKTAPYIHLENGNIIVIIERDPFLYEEDEYEQDN
jgi:hypothetical protein